MTLPSGAHIGPYEITGTLGAGGMGEVYRATDMNLKRAVAIKVLPESVATDRDRLLRFQREAEVLASLNHPNIAAIYGLERSDGITALVMELVEGPTLADRIAQGPIPVDEALPIAKQIAEALEAAHEQGIIHRDLKPANVKVRPDGTVKVLDFGLAKALEPASGTRVDATASPTITSPAMMTGVGTLLGTAAYMSPEQARGKAVDKRSDIWAFGCVLYEMLTGKRAFEGDEVSDVLASVLAREPDWTLLPRGLSPVLVAFLKRCIHKDRRHRIGDAQSLRLALEGAFDTPRSHPANTATTAFWWRRPIPLAGVGSLFLGLMAAGAWGLLRDIDEGPPVARFSIPLTQGGAFSATAQQNLAISPDGTQIVYASNGRLFRRMLGEFDARELTGTETDAQENSPAFSPDGRAIAFFSDGAIRRVGIDGGAAVMLCAAEGPPPFGLTWDGSGILIGQGPQGIARCPATGGRLERLATVNEGEQAQGPQILPGTDLLMFTVSSLRDGPERWDTATVVMQSLSSGNRTTIVKGGSDARYLPTGHLVYGVSGTVFAVSFDPRNPSRIGAPVPVIQGVRRALQGTTGAVHVATSDAGVLLYIPGPVQGRSARRSIGMADRGGTVVRAAVADGAYAQVRASRDGKFLALAFDDTKEAIVSILPLDGASAARRLTFEGRNRFPVWSPDGVRVAFQSDRDGDLAVFGQRADGTGVAERLTRPEKGEAHAPASWSPDGKTLLFTVQRDDTYALWSLSIESGATARVGDVRSGEPLDSVFSPDGRWMAYHVGFGDRRGPDRAPDSGVYVQPFPPTGARYQAPRLGVDFHPAWSPDGSSLIYVPSAASGQMAVVPVTKGTGITFGAPAQLRATVTGLVTSQFSRAYDILPDGRLVGLLSAGDDPSATGVGTGDQMRVVLNWFEELERLVPN